MRHEAGQVALNTSPPPSPLSPPWVTCRTAPHSFWACALLRFSPFRASAPLVRCLIPLTDHSLGHQCPDPGSARRTSEFNRKTYAFGKDAKLEGALPVSARWERNGANIHNAGVAMPAAMQRPVIVGIVQLPGSLRNKFSQHGLESSPRRTRRALELFKICPTLVAHFLWQLRFGPTSAQIGNICNNSANVKPTSTSDCRTLD